MAEQRTDEWRQARCGKLTASRFHEAVARIQKGWGASRNKYLWQLVIERYTGNPTPEGWKSQSMRFGTDNEFRARAAYTFYAGEPIEQEMFTDHPRIANAGCSLDGKVGQFGLIECKVPDSDTHMQFFMGETAIPDQYMKQMYWQLACCPERQWVDYVSFDPRLPEECHYKCVRIHRDNEIIRAMEDDAVSFLREVDAKLMRLRVRISGGNALSVVA